jgi:hypothetical protein
MNFSIHVDAQGNEVLHRSKTPKTTKNKAVNLNDPLLPVAIQEGYFEIIYNVHSVLLGHPGQKKTYDAISMRYHCLPKQIIVAFIRLCPHCNLKQKQMSQPRLNPIRSASIFDRFQIDLVDMRHNRVYLDSRQYCDKHISKADKEAKAKELKEKKTTALLRVACSCCWSLFKISYSLATRDKNNGRNRRLL